MNSCIELDAAGQDIRSTIWDPVAVICSDFHLHQENESFNEAGKVVMKSGFDEARSHTAQCWSPYGSFDALK